MEFTFPDSGRTVELERVPFTTLALLRAHYEISYPNKPTPPFTEIKDGDEVVERIPNESDPEYLKAKSAWTLRMTSARWAAEKELYAKCVRKVDAEAVQHAVEAVQDFMDLRAEILKGYADLDVPFESSVLDQYIYLWHVCITSSSEQSIFQNWMQMGSQSSQKVVEEYLFRLRSQV